MGFTFRKSFKLGAGLRFNLGSRGANLSGGGGGFRWSTAGRGGRGRKRKKAQGGGCGCLLMVLLFLGYGMFAANCQNPSPPAEPVEQQAPAQ